MHTSELSSKPIIAVISFTMVVSVNSVQALSLALKMSPLRILSVCLLLVMLNPYSDLRQELIAVRETA